MARYELTTPLSEEDIRRLHAGDEVLLNGVLFTGRDALHKHLSGEVKSEVDLEGQVIYHCGPVIVGEENNWEVKAAGPTTSNREEPYQAGIIQNYRVRGVIGKGGMGAKTLQALHQFGAVYLHAVGGAAQVYAERILKVHSVQFPEFGSPEAMWKIEVKDFPCVVTMDSHGNSLHEEVKRNAVHNLKQKLV